VFNLWLACLCRASSAASAAATKPPTSSWALTCMMVLATSKGCAISTDVYFHSSSSSTSLMVWTTDGDGSAM
jgi:invasion protein IalB